MRQLRTIKRGKAIQMQDVKCGEGTIIHALEKVLITAHESELAEETLRQADEQFKFLEEKLSFTRMQAMVVAMLVDHGSTLSTARMAGYLGIRNIRMLTYMEEIEQLVRQRIISIKKPQFDDNGYQINPKALEAFMKNCIYEPEPIANLTTKQLIDTMRQHMYECEGDEQTYEQLLDNTREIIDCNKNHTLCKKTAMLETYEVILFFFCLEKYVTEGNLNITDHEFSSVFDRHDFNRLRNAIASRRGALFSEKLLGEAANEGFSPRENVAISDEVREYIDKELGLSWEPAERDQRAGLLNFENIKEKSLFYNPEDCSSLDKLAEMLKQENFTGIQARMTEKGMRSGFACLFYGAPGTGKTETVMQLARATGRDIMQVNVANIKSKWVGDSEKNIKGIFNRYRNYCEKCNVKPILLFNEADAIINKRSTNIDRSVDKMENAIQNIILEEIEQLDGILIATTNLADNMDKAFERRFIYKVEFHKPNVETKKHIWQSMIGELDDNDAITLANEFDLSGGQIENVMRKQFVDNILYGEQPTLARLRDYCKQECFNAVNSENRTRIGF